MSPSRISIVTRTVVLHAILIGGLPVLQGASFVPGGWTESVTLLAVYFVVPLSAVWLAHRGYPRPAAIVLLGFMASGVVVNTLFFAGLVPPAFSPPIWLVLFRAWILGLIVIQIVIGWIAFLMLRDIHRRVDVGEGPHYDAGTSPGGPETP